MKRLALQAALVAMLLTIGTTVAEARTIHVSPGDDVQAAIDGAKDGDTVMLRGGVYDTQIVIDGRELTLRGQDGAVLQPTTLSTNAMRFDGVRPVAAVIAVLGGDVTIDNIGIDGSIVGPGAPRGFTGIFVLGAQATVTRVAVDHIWDTNASGRQDPVALLAEDSDTVVSHGLFTRFGKNGPTFVNGGTAVVVQNTVIGRGTTLLGDAAQNGIQMGFGTDGYIAHNDVSDIRYGPNSFGASGILVIFGADVVIEKNLVTDCEFAITSQFNQFNGFFGYGDPAVVIAKNRVQGGPWGIFTNADAGTVIEKNDVRDTTLLGVGSFFDVDVVLSKNRVSTDAAGVVGFWVFGSTGTLVEKNDSDADFAYLDQGTGTTLKGNR